MTAGSCIRAAAIVLLAFGAPAAAARVAAADAAQEADFGSDLDGYRRFLVYPHVQKGLDAQRRGDLERAIAELRQAHQLAPESHVVALHLARAYVAAGRRAQADSVVRAQLARAPGHEGLTRFLDQLQRSAAATERAVAARGQPTAAGTAEAPAAAVDGGSGTAAVRPRPAAAATRGARTGARAAGAPPEARVPSALPPDRLTFAAALAGRRFADARHQAELLLARDGDAGLLDELSYQMVVAGAAADAGQLLMARYPFPGVPDTARETLLLRLLAEPAATAAFDGRALALLRLPLDTPALRARQAVYWAQRGDCAAVRALLGDRSPAYGYDDWMRLGDCAAGETDLARQAYARAHELRPGSDASRALAYAAHAAGDHPTALAAWRSIDARLVTADLPGAADSALAAGDAVQAAAWLDRYLAGAGAPDRRYWLLRADVATARGDAAATRVALERLVEQQPTAGDLLRLSALQQDPARQVRTLEQAAGLGPRDAAVLGALGYAYLRAGRVSDALRTLQRAAAIDPRNGDVYAAIGYLHWDAGRIEPARAAFERAWQLAPDGNPALAEQLVYVHQRLHHTDDARRFAERVLDAATVASSPAGQAEYATKVFGLRRLHEDLGRRLTVNLDGWSGTRVGTGTPAAVAGSRFSSYGQVEADLRLGREPIRDGSTVSAFARLFGDGGPQRRPLPFEHLTAGAGLRWKPWRRLVLYVSAEGQTRLDGSSRELLLRVSASLFNGGRFSDDWHPAGRGWYAQNLFVDTARYTRQALTAGTVDSRHSYHVKLGPSATLEPYVRLQANGLWSDRLRRDVRLGGGARLNVWAGGTRYDAPPHRISLGVELQEAVSTYLQDRRALFLSLGARW